ncbi:MAG: SHOCT domain-containing protein [Planctomycetota bacterium]|jgi:hypothetical protein
MIGSFADAVVRVLFCTLLYFVLPAESIQAEPNPVYKDGDTYVELKDAEGLKGASPPFNHPYIIQEEKLRKILSSLSYRQKGILVKKGGKPIFNNKEVETLAPLIADALSKSNANEYLYVYSQRDRSLLDDLETVFSLFVEDDDMNVAFSRVLSRADNVPRTNRKREFSEKDPTSIKSSGFWELAHGEGQVYQEGHRNWLVINVKERTFDVEPEPLVSLAEEEGEVEFFNNRSNSVIEERLRKIEERVGLKEGSAPVAPLPRAKKPAADDGTENLNEKFRDLKELLDNDLISPEDYKYKKKELLKRESQTGKSIPQRLKDLRNLMDEGLISERDYEKKKRELLDRL